MNIILFLFYVMFGYKRTRSGTDVNVEVPKRERGSERE